MKREALADYLWAEGGSRSLGRLLDKWRADLDIELLRLLVGKLAEAQRQQAQRAMEKVPLLHGVAERIGTAEARGMAYWLEGVGHSYLSQYRQALAAYKQAEGYYAQLKDWRRVAGLKVNRVSILRDMGAYAEALTVGDEARQTFVGLGEEQSVYFANLEMTLGVILTRMGEMAQAWQTYEHSRQVFMRLGEEIPGALLDINRADWLRLNNRYEAAEGLLAEAQRVLAEAGYVADGARAGLQLGWLAYEQGRYLQALEHLGGAYEQYESIPMPVEMGLVDLRRALVYQQLSLYPEALALIGKSKRLFKQKRMRVEYALGLLNEAKIYQRTGLWELAEKRLGQARRIWREEGVWLRVWEVDVRRAEVAWLAGHLERGWRIGRRLEGMVTAEWPPLWQARLYLLLGRLAAYGPEGKRWVGAVRAADYFEQGLGLSRRYHLRELGVQLLYEQANLAVAGGDWRVGWTMYEQAMAECEWMRQYLILDEFQVGFMADKLPIYEAYVGLVHRLKIEGAVGWERLVNALERWQVAPLMNQGREEGEGAGDDELASLRQAWHWYQNQLVVGEWVSSGEGRGEVAAKLAEIEMGIKQAQYQRRARYGGGEVRQGEERPLLSQIQINLGANEGLLHLYEVAGKVQVFCMRGKRVWVMAGVAEVAELGRLLTAWSFYVENTARLGGGSEGRAQMYLRRLYALLGDVWVELVGCERLYVSGPPTWAAMPWAALFDGESYLIERYELVQVTSLAAVGADWR
ncbi:MAG TPA: hypothetical protein VLL52_16350, partial [Anaerolineae bacterium]|nr:hypothetical protein [Anaerolineae bacterium]